MAEYYQLDKDYKPHRYKKLNKSQLEDTWRKLYQADIKLLKVETKRKSVEGKLDITYRETNISMTRKNCELENGRTAHLKYRKT